MSKIQKCNIISYILIFLTILFLSVLPIHAAGNDFFDPDYYRIKYPDVVKVFGASPDKLYQHYNIYGRNEGRFKNKLEDPTMRSDLPYQTYVDVDIDAQVVKYYNSGILVMQAPCVTGNTSLGRDTPKGEWQIETKTKGKWLTGPTWHVWVDYWMRFTPGACGLHDAAWRKGSEFGGDTYKTNGSHGCVNLPHDFSARLYEAVDIGTRVYVH